jgi:transcriptional regulator with XRE-family HTH domain
MTGIELKKAIKELNLSQAEFGRRIDMSSNTVSSWVCGRIVIPRLVELYIELLLGLRRLGNV